MRLVLLAVLIIAGVYFYNNFSVKPHTVSQDNVLGTTAQAVQNTVNQIVPPQAVEKVLTDTGSRVLTTVQEDVNTAISQAVNNVLAGQLVNNFKNLPKPVQEQVKQNICK
ncbi:MAG: hypothetical protein M1120_00850 [Patescibacteria group bacterium]|nr:hypothetical protein [Patescibacteria group bacterium]